MCSMKTTHPTIRILNSSLEHAKRNNHSTIHAFEDGIDKTIDNSILENQDRERAFNLNLLMTRQVIKMAATERLKSLLVQKVREVVDEQQKQSDGPQLRPSDTSALYSIVDKIQFYDVVSKRNVGSVNLDNLMKIASEVSGMSQDRIDTFIAVAEQPIINTNEYIHEILTSLINDISQILTPSPSSEDWERVFVRINETYTELDHEVRFVGDVS